MAEDGFRMAVTKSRNRIVRYADLRPCFDAFIDTRSPGSDKKENFTIIGPGVSENPNQYVHIAEPHGFNIGGARQPPGCLNSQHSHDTVEVFFVHSGTWSFDLGEHADDANIILNPGDIISIPTQVFRGFKNIGDDVGYLWAILGQDDPGRVLWAPHVFDMAKDYGLVLLENGLLVDTANGEVIPEGMKAMPVTSADQVQALQKFSADMLRKCCVMLDEVDSVELGPGCNFRPLIGAKAKLNWEHGFSVDQITLDSRMSHQDIAYEAAEVIFVHEGQLSIQVGEDPWTLEKGDTATIPKSIKRKYMNMRSEPVEFLRVRGDL